ncbi:MAG: glycosyltransferase family 39 protein [Bacteroidetes bacterium]|nr:glycosyltransferase family 39 protein [Bacteroidota bacterium]
MRILPSAFFVLYFVIGLLCASSYGLGWDDEWSRTDTGYINYNYIVHHQKEALLNGNEKYHGPFFEVILVCAEKILNLEDMHTIYQMRHIVLFLLFFVSVLAFYRVARKLFSANYAVLACLFLVLSPRFFAEAFFNSKDIVLLSFFNLSLYSCFLFFEKRNAKWAVLHGLFTGMLIAVRIVGIVIPMITIGYYVLLLIMKRKEHWRIQPLFGYILVSSLSTILCWPILWEGPLHHFIQAFAEMKKYHWDATVLYFGKQIDAAHLPWHYLLTWIFITTPVLFIILFFAGFIRYAKNSVTKGFSNFFLNYQWNTIWVLLLMPILSVIVLHSVVYDGWRHVYFIYPLFILIAVYGIFLFAQQFRYIVHGIILLQLFSLFYWSVKNHPFQQVYFNPVSQMMITDIGTQFECDYWGLSYKQGIEWLIENHTHEEKLKIAFQNLPGELNVRALPIAQRNKIDICSMHDSTANYYITNYRWSPPPADVQLLHQIKVDGMAILGIYKKGAINLPDGIE